MPAQYLAHQRSRPGWHTLSLDRGTGLSPSPVGREGGEGRGRGRGWGKEKVGGGGGGGGEEGRGKKGQRKEGGGDVLMFDSHSNLTLNLKEDESVFKRIEKINIKVGI